MSSHSFAVFGDFPQSERSLKEQEILAFWEERSIFQKTVEREGESFVFFEGPPTANGRPGLHHLEARTFKDAVPRYKTMRGFRVERKAGWDTHGLPVELEVEKDLGLTTKKQVEEYGIAQFNSACKKNVWKYRNEWEAFTRRTGYWVDLENPYVTYHNSYIESVWSTLAYIENKGYIYSDYNVLPWCPRCETALSSHELAQEYKDIKDLTVTVAFPQRDNPRVQFLAWTTTPWTLFSHMALALGSDIQYSHVQYGDTVYICAQERVASVFSGKEYTIIATSKGVDLKGIAYNAPYQDVVMGLNPEKDFSYAYKTYCADFVTTTDGTGIVHMAPMYGQDDFACATANNIPKIHTVNQSGKFIQGIPFADRFVKDEEVAVDIIKDLASRGLLFSKEKYEHSYPHCWRCKTPVIYYARDSWYIAMSRLKDKLVEENQKISWDPTHVRDGRFGDWVKNAKDWSLSRERYWGTPLPIWQTQDKTQSITIRSITDLRERVRKGTNTYLFVRHGHAVSNEKGVVSTRIDDDNPLTEQGVQQTYDLARDLAQKGATRIITSPFQRARETANIIASTLGISQQDVVHDDRLREGEMSPEYQGVSWDEINVMQQQDGCDKYTTNLQGCEVKRSVLTRLYQAIESYEQSYQNETIVIVTHGVVTQMIRALNSGIDEMNYTKILSSLRDIGHGEIITYQHAFMPRNEYGEIDLHKPYIDSVILCDEQGNEYKRTPEVIDVWYDSGAMPYAQHNILFHDTQAVEQVVPADFISEATDQTRGWFYTLHAIGVLLDRGKAFNHCTCLGHVMAADGTKMSKSRKNFADPWCEMSKYGVDTLRLWMIAVNDPGDSKNYDEKSVVDIQRKIIGLFSNCVSLYTQSCNDVQAVSCETSDNPMDQWIMARYNQVYTQYIALCDEYRLTEAVRLVRDFIADISQWYIRNSRERIKDGDPFACATTVDILKKTSMLLAPFAPFFAEEMWQLLRNQDDEESVHLARFGQEYTITNTTILQAMEQTRDVVSRALQERHEQGIKVRQVLQSVTITSPFSQYINETIQEQVNVKEVIIKDGQEVSVSLDTHITPELYDEGNIREFVRSIQAVRKERGLVPQDPIAIQFITTSQSFYDLVDKNKEYLNKIACIQSYNYVTDVPNNKDSRDIVVIELSNETVTCIVV